MGCWGTLEEFSNRSFISVIPGEPRGCPLARKKKKGAFHLQCPQTLNCSGRLPHPQRLPSLLHAKQGALPDTGAVTWPPSSGAAAWPTTLEEPKRKLHRGTVLFHCTAQGTSAGFLLCRQEAPPRIHPKSLSAVGVGACCAERQKNPTKRGGGSRMLQEELRDHH